MATFDGNWKRPNRPWANQKEDVRRLRREQTPAEKALWARLRAARLDGFKFRRQHPLGKFAGDFCCPAKKLIVEIDGSVHVGREEEDAARQAFLESRGYRFLRVTNKEVLTSIESVLGRISAFLRVE